MNIEIIFTKSRRRYVAFPTSKSVEECIDFRNRYQNKNKEAFCFVISDDEAKTIIEQNTKHFAFRRISWEKEEKTIS